MLNRAFPSKRGRGVMGDLVSEQIARFLDFMTVERGVSPNTLDAYRRDLGRYGRYLAEKGLDDAAVAPEEVVAGFVARLSSTEFAEGRRYAASSVARSLAAVRTFHMFLVREGDAAASAAE